MLCCEKRQGGCSYFQLLKAHEKVVTHAYTQNTTLGCLIHQPDLTTEMICCNPLFHLCSFSGYNQMLIQINTNFSQYIYKISNSYSWLSPIPDVERVLIIEGVWHTQKYGRSEKNILPNCCIFTRIKLLKIKNICLLCFQLFKFPICNFICIHFISLSIIHTLHHYFVYLSLFTHATLHHTTQAKYQLVITG